MAVIYSDTLKINRLQIMADRIAGKTAGTATGTATAGQLVIGTSALAGATGVLATLALPTAPFGISGTGTVFATLAGTPLSVTASATGTAAKAEFRQNNGTTVEVFGLTVGLTGSGADIILTSTSITSGQTVTVTSGTITHG